MCTDMPAILRPLKIDRVHIVLFTVIRSKAASNIDLDAIMSDNMNSTHAERWMSAGKPCARDSQYAAKICFGYQIIFAVERRIAGPRLESEGTGAEASHN